MSTITKNCLVCNENFYKEPSHSRKYWSMRRYCSRTCAVKVQYTKEMREKISKANKGKHYSPSTEFKAGNKKLPNAYSFGKGSNNLNWKGGKGSERHMLMGRIEYKQWRKAVFERDNYTCQLCGQRGGKLNADHIKPWTKYPELRYVIDNGRTLCKKPCHLVITRRQIADGMFI